MSIYEKYMNEHIQKHHKHLITTDPIFIDKYRTKCNGCETPFSSHAYRFKHENAMKNKDGTYKCSVQKGLTFTSKKQRNSHRRTKLNPRPMQPNGTLMLSGVKQKLIVEEVISPLIQKK
eukprot:398155_1